MPRNFLRRGRRGSHGGGFTLANVLVLAVVLVAAAVAAVLLGRTMAEAQNISDKAAAIAASGRGINVATDSVIALNRTNELAATILDSVAPLDEDLTAILDTAQDVDATAGSIDTTAGRILERAQVIDDIATTIDDRAGTIEQLAASISATADQIETAADDIEATAAGINQEAAEIIDVAERIEFDVAQINRNLNTTIALAEAILSDTGDVLRLSRDAHVTASCIDNKLAGGSDGHCPALNGAN